MTKPVDRPYLKPGRKPFEVPRKQKHIYMTERAEMAVKEWVAAERSEGHTYSFSDAIEAMVDLASFYYAERNAAHKLQPVADVLAGLWVRRKLPWVRIEPNSGRHLRCTACKTSETIKARRFSGISKAISTFVEAHRSCGKG